ncbi:unnamed protein product, partial [marine sediment metagenome]
DLLVFGTNETSLILNSYMKTVIKGTYTLKIFNIDQDQLYKKKFTFDDPNLKILSCNQRWWYQKIGSNKVALVELSLNLFNDCNFPLYPASIDLIIDSEIFSNIVFSEVINPFENKEIRCYIITDINKNQKNFSLFIKDNNDNILSNGTYKIDITNKIDTKYYNWDYRSYHYQIKLPNLDFLYSYYKEINRINREDYSVYIFNEYDESFIDLISDQINNISESFDDIDLINFAASFVQNLPYKKDSEINDTFEYPRYPVETLFYNNGCGDCEDKAILLANILINMDYNICFIKT